MNKRQRKKWDKAIEERLRRENEELRRQNTQLKQENAHLQERLAKLESSVGQNSRNSSLPPSSDPPWASAPAPKPGSGRKPGGQPGHKGHRRELVTPEKVTQTIPVKPENCRGCGSALRGQDPNPHRHQVTEIPKVEAHITEYQLHTLECVRCGITTTAVLPPGVPRGAFGPRAVAVASLLSGYFHLGKRPVVEAMSYLFGVRMALGSVSSCEQTTSEALKEPVSEAQAYVKEQQVKQGDETSWYEGSRRLRVWLWVAFTEQVTVFLIRSSRGADIAKELLGKAFGVLITDRWCAYTWWPLKWRQLCWAHLKRHFQAFVEAGGEAGRIGQALLNEERLLFEWWHRVRDGTLSRSTFRTYVSPLRQRIEALLAEGSVCGHRKTEGMCREILKLAPAMWTFVRVEGVSPTNNASERSVRRGVLWRKICFGTHSKAGSRFVERMLTVTCTLRQQGRNVLDYVTAIVEASMQEKYPPSLLPGKLT